jgi:saccharopine dehydrogenase-like NADP-dependent oxidoreductase
MNASKDAGDKKTAPSKGKWVLEIYITGEKDKKEITKCYSIELDNEDCIKKYGVDAEEYLEGTAIIASVKLMSADKWKKPGVFSPASFDSSIFFDALEAEGIEIKESESKPLL